MVLIRGYYCRSNGILMSKMEKKVVEILKRQ